MRLLVLGGTSEASALARALAGRADIAAILSLAGRTRAPAPAPIPVRSGGFGGAEGLRGYLASERIDAVIDATHPFAARMARHAAQACAAAGAPLLAFSRPPWMRQDGDWWIEVDTMEEAAVALGAAPRRVFLTPGRQQLAAFAAAPQHWYLVRAIDAPEDLETLPRRRLILARGPFSRPEEEALMRAERIDTLVSKNSGGEATYAKIEAARALRLPVVMVRRPERPPVSQATSVAEALAWLDGLEPARHRPAP